MATTSDAVASAATTRVVQAIEAVIYDPCLQVKSTKVEKLQALGRCILRVFNAASASEAEEVESRAAVSLFSSALYKTLDHLISTQMSKCNSLPATRTKLWAQFHHECNTSLPMIWDQKFPSSIIAEPCSILFQQSVNEKLFEILLPEKLSTSGSGVEANAAAVVSAASGEASMSPDELNVLRYACGFVPFKLLKSFEKKDSTATKYDRFIHCLGDMAVDSDEDGDLISYTRKWSAIVNRGGLFPLNDATFLFFLTIEKIVRVLLPQHILCCKSHTNESLRSNVIEKAVKNDEVQWRWNLLSQCIDCDEESKELLTEIIQLWVTVRGFSMTAGWLENYKMQSKTTTAKKPSLRKGLQS